MVSPAVQEMLTGSSTATSGFKEARPVVAAIATGLAFICLIFFREIRSAIEVWDQSTAYSHCYLILPMTVYLLWERRDIIKLGQVEPNPLFALAAVPLTLFWLLGERLGIMEARQIAVIAGVELLFLTVLGHRFFRSILGPLLYLAFLVPFGAFLTPALQQFTATFSIVGLDLLGIPNFSDRFTIETPAGVFFVAEACAGLRFLIAAIAFGVFYSLLSYTSPRKRLVFIAASIIVPIIANGFRALGIVVLGQMLGSAEAAAADHLIYGWIFFSAVMLLLIAGGHAFRDVYQAPVEGRIAAPAVPSRSLAWCVINVVVMLGLGPAVARTIDLTALTPTLPDLPTIVAPRVCTPSNQTVESTTQQRLSTVVCGGERFEIRVTAYPARSTSSAMTSERRRVTQEVGAENSAISTVELPGSAGFWTVVQTTDPNRLTAYASWVDGLPVTSSMAGRLAQARDSVFGSAYVPTLITITVGEPAHNSPARRRDTFEKLTGFLSEQSGLNARMAALTRLGN